MTHPPFASEPVRDPAGQTSRSRRRLRVLVVDDEEAMRHFLSRGLKRLEFDVTVASDGDAGIAAGSQGNFDLACVDLRMPGTCGQTVLSRLRTAVPDLPVILMTAHGSIATAVDAMQSGAADFVQKPFEIEELRLRIERAVELRQVQQENRDLKRQLLQQPELKTLVTASAAMQNLATELGLLAASSAKILLTGESGTGKSLIARAIHSSSERREGPFVAVNCPAIPESLFESELFGHEPGAFTGAEQARRGHAARAAGGTLFLDEIAELSLTAQAKLEHLLQDGEIYPLGATRPVPVDARILAATNQDLTALVATGRFRADLLWRLNVVQLRVPALRERREDVPGLVEQQLSRIAERSGSMRKSVTPEAMSGLCNYDWPGNVRELENLTERMAVLAGDRKTLGFGDLPSEIRGDALAGEHARGDYDAARRHFDRAWFAALLERCDGSVTEAARQAGLSRGHMHRKIKELGLRTEAGGTTPEELA
jgi:DNA-binding NtrC family response regulator